jgi:hypothetical protein
MDNKSFALLSKFAVSARKVIGAVNPAKLIKDNEYSAEIFQKAFELGDEELIVMALELQSALGIITPDLPETTPPKVAPIKPAEVVTEKKYMFGARS